jgi:L-ribulose-5-phosphate 4-epimerase
MGTTHSDFFFGAVPVTRPLSKREIAGDYEVETGRAILRRFSKLKAADIPAVLVLHHGPFTWGASVAEAEEYAVAVELCAKLAYHTLTLGTVGTKIISELTSRHFKRKHGPKAYYGQK